MTTLPLPPFITLVLGILLATALLYGVLSLMRRNPEAPMWEGFGIGWVAIIVILGLVWLGLFGLTLAAVFSGTWKAIEDPTVTTLGLGGLTAALLGAPFLIWSTVLKHQTVRWQKEGHMTDRISKAVEQLGAEKTVDRIGRTTELKRWGPDTQDSDENIETRTVIEWRGNVLKKHDNEWVGALGGWQVFSETVPNLEVRIGAILSLERIAQDSTTHDKGRDHVRVMEILCAYVRNNSPVERATEGPVVRGFMEGLTAQKASVGISELTSWTNSLIEQRTDLEIALRVLGKRDRDQMRIERESHGYGDQGYRLDLSGCNLQRADLTDCNFDSANFYKSNLDGAWLGDSTFCEANFTYSSLIGARAYRTDFSRANLVCADLSFADLRSANFIESALGHTHFVRAHLNDAKFFFEWNLNKRQHRINTAFFHQASMNGCHLSGDLRDGIEIRVDSGPDGSYYSITGASFRNCEIGNPAFAPVLPEMFGDGSVVLPEGVARPEHWPAVILNDLEFASELAKWRADPASYTPPPPP